MVNCEGRTRDGGEKAERGAGAAGLVVGRALYGGRIEAGMLGEKADGWEACLYR